MDYTALATGAVAAGVAAWAVAAAAGDGAEPGAGTGAAVPGLVATTGVALAAALVSRALRRAGREVVSSGPEARLARTAAGTFAAPATGAEPRQPAPGAEGDGAPEVAGALATVLVTGRQRVTVPATVGRIGDTVEGPPHWLPPEPVRVDDADLAALATVSFSPPAELTPTQAAMVLRERVTRDHVTTALMEAASAGDVHVRVVEDTARSITLTGDCAGTDAVTRFVRAAFAGRHEIRLPRYDEPLRDATRAYLTDLRAWRAQSRLWQPAGDRRRRMCAGLGALALAAAAVPLVAGSHIAGAEGGGGLALVAFGAILGGAGLAAVVRSWELRVRTPAGSALWVRLESFRRFLAQAGPAEVREAVARGVLPEYATWAVAVGAAGPWRRAMIEARLPSDTPGADYPVIATALPPAIRLATDKPSRG
jgi:Predicted membrane protein (DUF2207)